MEAMKKRADIHFKREEFEECVIECEEILKINKTHEVTELKQKAKENLPQKQAWYDVFKVAKDATKDEIRKTFHKLAKMFSTNSKKNSKLLKIDKIKADMRMAKINEAKKNCDSLK